MMVGQIKENERRDFFRTLIAGIIAFFLPNKVWLDTETVGKPWNFKTWNVNKLVSKHLSVEEITLDSSHNIRRKELTRDEGKNTMFKLLYGGSEPGHLTHKPVTNAMVHNFFERRLGEPFVRG